MISNLTPQVHASHYTRLGYLFPERWASYWHQIDAVRACTPERILEIGVGNNMVTYALRMIGLTVDTLDIDSTLYPTYVGSVICIPVQDEIYDVVLCAEVLEHLPWDQFSIALAEIKRVTKKTAIITLPHAGYVFSFLYKIPFVTWRALGFKIPFFWKTHIFNGQHYWETGKKGYARSRILRAVKDAGFVVKTQRIFPDDPAHFCMVCEKI